MKRGFLDRAGEWAQSVPHSVWSPVSYVGLAGALLTAIMLSSSSKVIPPIIAALSNTDTQDPMVLFLAVTALRIFVALLGLGLLAVLASLALLQKSQIGWVMSAAIAVSIVLGAYEHMALLPGHWLGFSAWAALQCGSIFHPNAAKFAGFNNSEGLGRYFALAAISGVLLLAYAEVIELFEVADNIQKSSHP